MTKTDTNHNSPRSLSFSRKLQRIPLIIEGQGVFIFDNQELTLNCSFNIFNNDKSDGLKIIFTSNGVKVNQISNDDNFVDISNNGGLVGKSGAYYWFSIDSHNYCLMAGVGEARVETAIYKYVVDDSKNRFLKTLVSIELTKDSSIRPLRLLRDPITTPIALSVKNMDELTMDELASGTYMPKANLNTVSQQLYEAIAGSNFTLNTPDFPEFAQAIEKSIATPGLWCYNTLKAKAQEFGKQPNPMETYLRITLGQNNGESPGVPYVMEIWPPNHYSPIHNHGGANAVIRVLHGGIHVMLFPYLSTDDVAPFATADFVTDDITWIGPTLNQVHQLKNIGTDTCITIQCYMYDTADSKHYDYFDYIDGGGAKRQFEPDSDMDFVAFKALMKSEWKRDNMHITRGIQTVDLDAVETHPASSGPKRGRFRWC
jgi:hypothetical protein